MHLLVKLGVEPHAEDGAYSGGDGSHDVEEPLKET